ncbi:MAG: MFS transporter [Spirochaetales bacterium]|nr:MFS transporter [Spirochaetales bacterium]
MELAHRRSKVFYGNYIIAAAVGIILYTGGIVHFGFTAVFEPIVNEFGWSYAQVSLASSLRGFEMGLLAPLIGILVDKFGPRRLIFCGSLSIAIGFVLLSRVSTLAGFYGAFLFIALGMSTCSGTVLLTAVTNWFRRKAGLAIGIVSSGFGLGGLMVPLVTLLVDSLGWRTAMLIFGLGMVAIVLPLSFVIRHKPEQYGYLPDGDEAVPVRSGGVRRKAAAPDPEVSVHPRQALRGRVFWQLAIASACHAFVIGAVVTHLMPYLSSVGVSRSLSSVIAFILPLASIAGRLGSGWLSDRIGSRFVFSLSFLLMIVGMLIFAYIGSGRQWLLIPFVFALSLGWGLSVTTRTTLVRQHFGRAHFGKIIGAIFGVMMIGNITGAPLAGRMYDTVGSYHVAWLSFAVIALVGTILVFTIPPARKATRMTPR